MTIRLISADERFETTVEGCKFFYRRLPDDVQERLRDENTERGKFNSSRYMMAVLAYCILGWDGVTDHNGDAVAYSPERFRSFPLPPLQALARTIMFSVAGETVEAGPNDPF